MTTGKTIATLFIPQECGPIDVHRRAMLNSLVGEDISTFSERERAVYECASRHGECYWASIFVGETAKSAQSDLGDPSTEVTLIVPPQYSNRRLLEALDAATQVLLELEVDQ